MPAAVAPVLRVFGVPGVLADPGPFNVFSTVGIGRQPDAVADAVVGLLAATRPGRTTPGSAPR